MGDVTVILFNGFVQYCIKMTILRFYVWKSICSLNVENLISDGLGRIFNYSTVYWAMI